MSNNRFSATLIAALIAAGGLASTVHAGHSVGHGVHGYSSGYHAHHGYAKRHAESKLPAKLGVAISALPQVELEKMGLEYGVRIDKVLKGSTAEAAGLLPGDVVTEIDGRPTYSTKRMQYLISRSGGKSEISVMRDGEAAPVTAVYPLAAGGKARLGVHIQEMTDDLKQVFGSSNDAGVLVAQVAGGSPAQKAGLKAGDVIVAIAGEKTTSVEDVHRLIGQHSPGDSVTLAYVREREQKSVEVALEAVASQQLSMHRPYHPHGYGMPFHHHRFHGSHMPKYKQGCTVGKRTLRS